MNIIDNNTIRFVDCLTADILKEGCTDPFALNYDPWAIYEMVYVIIQQIGKFIFL